MYNTEHIYYLEDGTPVAFVGELGGQLAIQRIHSKPDEELRTGKTFFYDGTLFESEDATPWAEKLTKLDAEWKDLVAKVKAERAALDATLKERKDLLVKLGQVSALKRLEDFLDGKVTHFVADNHYELKVKTFDEVVNMDEWEHNSWPKVKQMRLISLCGGSKGDLSWWLHEYSSPSRDQAQIFPCSSLEEARGLAGRLIAEIVLKWRGATGGDKASAFYRLAGAARSCKELEFAFPEDAATALLESAKKSKDAWIATKEYELAKAKAEREALDAQAD